MVWEVVKSNVEKLGVHTRRKGFKRTERKFYVGEERLSY